MFFLVSSRYKFLMGWSAKCGCSSVKKWYLDIHDIRPHHLGMEIYKAIGYGNTKYTKVAWKRTRLYQDYAKYAVVRNPYSRVVSGFLNKYVVHREIPNKGWSTFQEFLETLRLDTNFKLVDKHHFTPQFSEDYRYFAKSGMQFDRVIPLEHLQAALDEISAELGAATHQAPRANATEYANPEDVGRDWANVPIADFKPEIIPSFEYFYNSTTRQLVDEIYRQDFEILRTFGLDYQSGDGSESGLEQ